MYSRFRVQNFRSLKNLELKDLARINLIGGRNNVGKTSLLEALFVMLNPHNPELLFRVNGIRGIGRIRIDTSNSDETPLDSLFYGFDSKTEIMLHAVTLNNEELRFAISVRFDVDEIISKDTYTEDISHEASSSVNATTVVPIKITDNAGNERIARALFDGKSISYSRPNIAPRHPSYYFASIVRENFEVIAERYSNIVNNGYDNLILETLQRVEPRIKSIQLLYQNGEPILTADTGMGKKIPLNYMGDGIVRLLQFALAIGNAENGVVLIDEIENGLHYSILPMIWSEIAEVAKQFNVQIFATTHSMEMIRAAHQAFADTGEDNFRYYRLDHDPETGIPVAVKYTQKTVNAAVKMGYEIRG